MTNPSRAESITDALESKETPTTKDGELLLTALSQLTLATQADIEAMYAKHGASIDPATASSAQAVQNVFGELQASIEALTYFLAVPEAINTANKYVDLNRKFKDDLSKIENVLAKVNSTDGGSTIPEAWFEAQLVAPVSLDHLSSYRLALLASDWRGQRNVNHKDISFTAKHVKALKDIRSKFIKTVTADKAPSAKPKKAPVKVIPQPDMD